MCVRVTWMLGQCCCACESPALPRGWAAECWCRHEAHEHTGFMFYILSLMSNTSEAVNTPRPAVSQSCPAALSHPCDPTGQDTGPGCAVSPCPGDPGTLHVQSSPRSTELGWDPPGATAALQRPLSDVNMVHVLYSTGSWS